MLTSILSPFKEIDPTVFILGGYVSALSEQDNDEGCCFETITNVLGWVHVYFPIKIKVMT
jgi:hypothetical protein